VMSRNLDQDPLELSDGGWQSFDNLYYFKPLTDDIDFDLVSGLLVQFFEYEPEFYRVIMEGVKGELPSPMEEEAYQLRSFRLSSIGFPEFFEAREIFLFEDPEKIAREIRAETGKVIYLDEEQAQQLPPHYWLIPNTRGGFFERLMGEAADDERVAHLFWELSYLVHKVVAASGEDLSDTEGLVTSCQTARDYINLGLEYLAGGRHDDGKRIIREVYLVRIFRLGYTLALSLKKKQEALVRRLGDIVDPALWGGLTTEVIRGLSGKRPLIYEGLIDGADGYRNFRTLGDIKAATDFLETLSVKVRLVSEIVAIPDDIRPWLVRNARLYDWGPEHLFMTACVRACLSGTWEVVPLSEDELRDFARLLRDNREIPDGVISGLQDIIGRIAEEGDDKLSEQAAKFVRDTYEEFARQLSAIRTPEDIDRRYITGVILAQPL
jgi:hypothetical protein